ncbi:hypothetical protein FLAG1_10473 [Fusarium langsethiae]|uniref:Uncharacterized protein n=1 Tax=Fusarium langsethiae TaxID=179993 RepID=A0A0M9ENM2_FUSLA|nr:hypothetical protein FLAG1_10473 [Fusarium langsethiae]GKU08262.1 unnamed protein product [Fusarium langsethiae]GKU23012.1 unnamed protein product [Fusarium langsethiae]
MTNADVFTNPPSSTYVLGSGFSVSLGGHSFSAYAVSDRTSRLLLALYAIIIQFLFAAVWQLFATLIIVNVSINSRIGLVGLVAFWNCPDPISATFRSVGYLYMTLKSQYRTWVVVRRALLMFFVALITAVTSITVGILYADWMRLGAFAPVHRDSVYWPPFDTVSDESVIDIYSMARPGVLRALGSAEAGDDLLSKMDAVTITKTTPPDHTPEKPQLQIAYTYKVTAQDLGLQRFASLFVKITGNCRTNYSWAEEEESINGSYDTYYPWGQKNTNQSFSTLGPLYRLDFVTWLHPDIDEPAQHTNRSFAFLASTALVPSQSHSDDPWYHTRAANGSEFALGLQYVVRPHRPVLECWETTEVCVGGECYDSYLKDSPLPDGLALVFRTRFAHPMMSHISMSAGVTTLKSYIGSASGAFVDAGASSLLKDMTRLIMAGYLASRQVFQEIALSRRPSSDAPNLLDESVGVLQNGAQDFVVLADGVVALRLDLMILAPCLCVIFWILVGLIHGARKVDIWRRLSARTAALSATQLLRQLDEHTNGYIWGKPLGTIPEPPTTDDAVKIGVYGSGYLPPGSDGQGDGVQGPCIRYTRDSPDVMRAGESEQGKSRSPGVVEMVALRDRQPQT